MKILVACEYSGAVREAFRKLGHNAMSCDFLPADDESKHHYQGDMFDLFPNGENVNQFDMVIAFPPCTYLCSSGLHWNKRQPERAVKTEQALQFVEAIMNLPVERIAIENPVGCISTRIRKYDQMVQPYEYGDDASKRTCLWLKGLPKLQPNPSDYVSPRMVDGKPRWANQTDSGQNRLGPSDTRWKERSKTYPGIAKAMAEAWGKDSVDANAFLITK
ncbi:MAG: hypothetical protein JSV53_12110 [candidate division WOR-3 bacterium]|nr:MAG: hypothetical protein JSV53_12110 [candidate division WOR-3 bacterium]